MNVKFSIKDVKVKSPSFDVNVNIGEIKLEVENANVLEIAEATKELLKGVTEFKANLEALEHSAQDFYEYANSVPELDETFEKKVEDIKE